MRNHPTFLCLLIHTFAMLLVTAVAISPATTFAQEDVTQQQVQPAESDEDSPAGADSAEMLPTVAVLGFSAGENVPESLPTDLADLVSALLDSEPDMQLVDRQRIGDVMEEQAMSVMGFTDPQQVITVGRLTGAKLLVVGRVFSLAGKMVITAKVIGTETSRMEALVVRGAPSAVDDLAVRLARELAERLRAKAGELVARAPQASGDLPALQAILADKDKPVLGIVVLESHEPAGGRVVDVPDPACETEIKRMLINSGFTVLDVGRNDLARWMDQTRTGELQTEQWASNLDEVELIIVGEAFSTRRGQIGQLIACGARAEINLIDRESGRVLLAERATTRAVDTSEPIAGKSALASAGEALGMSLLNYFVAELPDHETDE